MDEKLRNMTSIYLTKGDKMLLLFRQGGRVVSDTWVGSAGGHFEEKELNDPKACVLRAERRTGDRRKCHSKSVVTIYYFTEDKGRNPAELLFFCRGRRRGG